MITHENPYGKEGNYNGPTKNYKDREKGKRGGGGEGEERRARKNFGKARRQKSQQEEHSVKREVVNIH
jgi:hypothetical protein